MAKIDPLRNNGKQDWNNLVISVNTVGGKCVRAATVGNSNIPSPRCCSFPKSGGRVWFRPGFAGSKRVRAHLRLARERNKSICVRIDFR